MFGQANDLPDQLIVGGLGYTQNSNPFGWGVYAKHVSGIFYSYNGFDVKSIKGEYVAVGKYQIPKMEFSPFTGFALRATQIGKVSLWTHATGGIAADGNAVVGAVGGGGFLFCPLKSGWGMIFDGTVNYNAISSTDWTIRIGFSYSGGK